MAIEFALPPRVPQWFPRVGQPAPPVALGGHAVALGIFLSWMDRFACSGAADHGAAIRKQSVGAPAKTYLSIAALQSTITPLLGSR